MPHLHGSEEQVKPRVTVAEQTEGDPEDPGESQRAGTTYLFGWETRPLYEEDSQLLAVGYSSFAGPQPCSPHPEGFTSVLTSRILEHGAGVNTGAGQ